MQLVEIRARDVKPIKLAEVGGLSNVVVIAGPNGVGKTRLITGLLKYVQSLNVTPNFSIKVQATNAKEQEAWGKLTLDTRDATDAQLLKRTLHTNRRRSKFASSFLNFESNRAIEKVAPYNWDWNFGDPFEEEVGWNFGMNSMTARFQDMIHAVFRKIRSRREAIALHFEELRKVALAARTQSGGLNAEDAEGKLIKIDPSKFPDTLEPFKNAFSQLLSPKQLLDPEIKNQQLFFRTETGEDLPITQLSSGEREVINIVFDFLLRSPSDCIIIFDEPELHLHPELAYRLLQTLRGIGERNQFIFCTHSAEIITASLNHTVVFVAPPKDDAFNQALIVKEDDETHQALKLLGQSVGIISLGKKLVLIEGAQGSLDKQTYGAIIKNRFPRVVTVPSGGRGLLQSFATLNDKVLGKTIWGVQFFMLCDRDALPLRDPAELEKKAAGRIKVLGRYHLENYFLDEHVIAKIFEPVTKPDDWLRSPEAIRTRLKEIARDYASYAAALTASAQFRERIGNVDIMPKGCDGKSAAELQGLMIARSNEEKARILGLLKDEEIGNLIAETMEKISESLAKDTEDWKALIPGRTILRVFCSQTPLAYENFKTAFINASESMPNNPFSPIIDIFRQFDAA